MIERFIAIYVFIDDIMIEIGHKEHAWYTRQRPTPY
jgi:hypothetical protein